MNAGARERGGSFEPPLALSCLAAAKREARRVLKELKQKHPEMKSEVWIGERCYTEAELEEGDAA